MQSKWTWEHTVETSARPQSIWAQWRDVEGWKKTDLSVVSSQLKGDFEEGATIQVKAKGAPARQFRITNFRSGTTFTMETTVPMAHLSFEHELKPISSGTSFTQRIKFTGPLAFLYAKMLGEGMGRDLSSTMARVDSAARESQVESKVEAGASQNVSD